jgi:membrane-bound serine protease (ClpP class)
MLRLLLLVLVVLAVLGTQTYSGTVVVELVGSVDGGMVSLVERSLRVLQPGELLVLRVDSYGGYLSSADRIAELLVNSHVDCVAYVPPGCKAVSAAAMVALACGRIYMGPASVIGAARPYPDDPKTVNYVASRFRALARRAFNNETLEDVAARFVTESLTLTDSEAGAYGLARRAGSLEEVLRELGAPKPRAYVSKDYWEQVISVISDPLVYSIALSVGFFLILAEIFTTGFQGYAIAGALLIAMALYGMNIIPPNLLVVALLLSGVILILVELMYPGLQGFGIAGLVLLAIGLYSGLRDRPVPVSEPSVMVAIAGLALLGAIFGVVVVKASQTIRMKRPSTRERLIGAEGIAKTDVTPTVPGVVHVLGEDWTAYSVAETIKAGSRVVVRDARGLILLVEEARARDRVQEEAPVQRG